MAERPLSCVAPVFLHGNQVSRVEGFTDAVPAFALTLPVVPLRVPRSFEKLAAATKRVRRLSDQPWFVHVKGIPSDGASSLRCEARSGGCAAYAGEPPGA